MPIGGLLSGAAGGATVAIVIKAVDQFSGTMRKAETRMDKLKLAGKTAGLAVAGITVGLAAFGLSAVKAAAETETMERQFRKMTYSSDDFLVSLNKATHQTVSDFELMSSANKALMLGLDQDNLGGFFEKAAILGQVAGRSVTEAVEDITLGVGRQSKLILDNLGIIVDAESAYEVYAQKIGVATSALNDNQKKTAFLEATLKGMTKTIEENGLVFEQGMAQKIEQVNKRFEDMKVAIGEGMIGPLSQSIDLIKDNEVAWESLGKTIGVVLGAAALLISDTVMLLHDFGTGVKTIYERIKLIGKPEQAALYKSGASYEESVKYGDNFSPEQYWQTKGEEADIRDRKQREKDDTMYWAKNFGPNAGGLGGAGGVGGVSGTGGARAGVTAAEAEEEGVLRELLKAKRSNLELENSLEEQYSDGTLSQLEYREAMTESNTKLSQSTIAAVNFGYEMEYLTSAMEGVTAAVAKAREEEQRGSYGKTDFGKSFSVTGKAAASKHDQLMRAAQKRDAGELTNQPDYGDTLSYVNEQGVRVNQVATGTQQSSSGGTSITMSFYNQVNTQAVMQDMAEAVSTTGAI